VVKEFLTKGRIVILSPLEAANGFVRPWPYLIYGSLGPHKLARIRHLDRFSRFCGTHPCDSHTDTQTNRPRYVWRLSQ